jgi:hypothetical protein
MICPYCKKDHTGDVYGKIFCKDFNHIFVFLLENKCWYLFLGKNCKPYNQIGMADNHSKFYIRNADEIISISEFKIDNCFEVLKRFNRLKAFS